MNMHYLCIIYLLLYFFFLLSSQCGPNTVKINNLAWIWGHSVTRWKKYIIKKTEKAIQI